MSEMNLPPSPKPLDEKSALAFRNAAAAARFDHAIFPILGTAGPEGWRARMRELMPRLPTPQCGTLARFFVVCDPMGRDEIAPAMGGREVLDAFEQSGIVAERDGQVWCPFHLNLAAGTAAFCDALGDPVSMSPPDEWVIPVSGSSRYVDDTSVRVPCELAIDMGCGQGFLALRSMTHAKRCIATDINPRAVELSRFNASMNGVMSRIDCRVGSFFEPLADVKGKVDLFTSNPPFVIQIAGKSTSAVTPTEGDGMMEHIIRTIPEMLSPGAWATVHGIWEHPNPADCTMRLGEWLKGSGCDALVLKFQTFSTDEYLRYSTPPEERAAAEPKWREFCSRRGTGALTYGGLVLKQRGGSSWLRVIETPIGVRSGNAAEQIKAYFATQTALTQSVSPTALLDMRFRSASGYRFDPEMGMPRRSPPSAPPGLGIPVPRHWEVEPVIRSFTGMQTARQVLDQLYRMGRVPAPAEHPATIGMVYGWASEGYLEVAV